MTKEMTTDNKELAQSIERLEIALDLIMAPGEKGDEELNDVFHHVDKARLMLIALLREMGGTKDDPEAARKDVASQEAMDWLQFEAIEQQQGRLN